MGSDVSYGPYKKLIVEKDPKDGRLLWIKFNYPERLNVLHLEMMNELWDALVKADRDPEVQAILLMGMGKAFCAGADVTEISSYDLDKGLRWLGAYWRNLDLLRETGKPTIAVVKGACVAGGNELAMMCDLVVAGKSARFGQPELGVGSTASGGGTQLLPFLIGDRRAREMVYTQKLLNAEEAYTYGLINRVVDDDEVEEEARKLALEIIDKSSPQAFRVVKSVFRFWTDLSMLTFRLARDITAMVWTTPEFRERVKEFLEKKPFKPRDFTGIMP
ncbi:MAG: enoyl-CoA hydratase/isomerase family protein [Candidatus Freyrarchaeum guaymaensis]|nr:enoyl-CoA hydratase/isomerase family protein [Candidatus Sigynarchaeota archaeon]